MRFYKRKKREIFILIIFYNGSVIFSRRKWREKYILPKDLAKKLKAKSLAEIVPTCILLSGSKPLQTSSQMISVSQLLVWKAKRWLASLKRF